MTTTQTKFRFPGTTGTVHQTGQQLSSSAGINLEFHTAEGCKVPHAVEVYSDDQSEYAELGLEWEMQNGRETLSGYDGAFEIPRTVLVALEFLGFAISQDMKEDPLETLGNMPSTAEQQLAEALAQVGECLRSIYSEANAKGKGSTGELHRHVCGGELRTYLKAQCLAGAALIREQITGFPNLDEKR